VLTSRHVVQHERRHTFGDAIEGDLRAGLEREIAAEGLGARVTLVGAVGDDELPAYLRLCDLFVLPHRALPDGDSDGFGLLLREAGACRKPVVCGRAGATTEALVDGHSGLVVDGNDAQQIAAAIERILGDPALAAQLAANGLQAARDNDDAAVARQFLRSCERLLGGYAR
jgi:phosphatidylinositol alpha-1,6-mannosyltransferase